MKTLITRRTKLHVCILTLTMAGLFAGCATKTVQVGGQEVPREQVIPLVGTMKVHRYVLDNGLRLLVVEDHTSPTFAYNTWFRVGSRDEVPGYTGLAHLFEHMMFKQTKTLKEGEFDRILESAGAEGQNAFTSKDYTAYVQELPSDKLELIAKLEADRMVNLVVDQKAFKTETEVVQNERRLRTENNPDGLIYQTLNEVAYQKHNYRWPVIGYQADLDRMNAADALEFYRAYYSPNHATIIVAGDVKPSHVLSVVEKYYGSLPAQPSPTRAHPAEMPQASPRRKQLRLSIQVEKLIMGYHIPDAKSEDQPALPVLAAVLSGGKSSRLHRALVETGIASGVDSYELENKDPSLFIVGANMQKGKKATVAESVILREIAGLQKSPVTDQELERAKNRLGYTFFAGLGSNSDRARFLGTYESIAGDFQIGLKQNLKVAAVTPSDVQAVAKRYLDPKNRSVITGVKK